MDPPRLGTRKLSQRQLIFIRRPIHDAIGTKTSMRYAESEAEAVSAGSLFRFEVLGLTQRLQTGMAPRSTRAFFGKIIVPSISASMVNGSETREPWLSQTPAEQWWQTPIVSSARP